MLVIEPATAAFCSTRFGRLLSHSRTTGSLIPSSTTTTTCNKITTRRNDIGKNRIRASSSDELTAKPQRYHPSEDISDSEDSDENGDAILGPAETSRTVIEVNSKAMLIEMELIGQAESDYDDMEEEDEDSGTDDDDEDADDDDEDDESGNYENEWVSLLEDEKDGEDSDESLGDWAKLETMRSSHPMHFAKQLAQFVSDDPVDYMDQPPAGLALQGVLRPAFVEDSSVINKYMLDGKSNDEEAANQVSEGDEEDLGVINGHEPESSQGVSSEEDESQKDQISGNGTSYYKLEIVKIHLISAHGNQTFVEVEDFRRAQPDAIAHLAPKIISRLKSGGEKTTQALKSLCWRSKGLQVEEVAVIGVDTLGFDVRVCSGRQVQTLRFAFKKRASSEYSAERQLNNLLFPRISGKQQKQKEAHQTEL
nr:hypothetical protein [Tanacetum cinerariifolium]